LDETNLDETKDSYITASLESLSLPANLKCDLYIFWKGSAETEYKFKETIALTGTQTKMKFMNADLKDKDYRFLFVATSAINPEISVSDLSNNALNIDKKWTDVLISSNEILLSADNYSGVLDKSGEDILKKGSIDGILTRMVGQIVLDIFRISGNINYPMDIISGDVSSVLDRVFKVEVEYSGITRDVVFGGSNNILDNNKWPDKYAKTHLFNTDNNLKVSVPQVDNGLIVSPIGKLGSARIQGIYCLPSDKNMRIKFIFHYYDTTPKCGDINHVHTKVCYDERELIINLPQDKEDATLLSVYPNYFTVNKAGIRLDRIIDLTQPGSFELATTWGN